jgi:SHS2 domain-containing protein
MTYPRYETLDHTADVYLIAHGATKAEAYANAAYGTFCQVAEVATLTPTQTVEVEVSGTDPENLLVEWLTEFVYRTEVEELIFTEAEVTEISETRLRGRAHALPLADVPEDCLYVHIKAVTYHQLRIQEREGAWEIHVVLDI